MKQILLCILFFSSIHAFAQENTNKFDSKNWESPYHLDTPAGWDIERFTIPISFAPEIVYSGVEDIRFAPGWAKQGNSEYWSYAFLWYLDGNHKFDEKIIESNLSKYYEGLFKINTDPKKSDTTKLIPVKVIIHTAPKTNGDAASFKGTVFMNDYMTRKPIKLNILIHIKSCEGQNKTYAFHELSPQPFSNEVWKSLDSLWLNFKCSKTEK